MTEHNDRRNRRRPLVYRVGLAAGVVMALVCSVGWIVAWYERPLVLVFPPLLAAGLFLVGWSLQRGGGYE